MDIKNGRQTIFNVELARYVGLYQILNPDTARLCGYNVCHIVCVCFASFMCAVSSLAPFGLYYLTNDAVAFVYYLGCVINYIFACCKIFTILYHAGDLWTCCDVASHDFLSYRRYNGRIFRTWRRHSARISGVIITISALAFVSWSSSPYFFNSTIVTVKNIDDSYSYYRINIFNLYFVVSDETYNAYFNVFYLFEIVICLYDVYFNFVFDILMVFICFALSCQLETISNGIESLGHEWTEDTNSKSRDGIQLETNLDITQELKIILKDHQNVIKKLNDYHNILRPVFLAQIFSVSSSQIFIWFIAAMSFSGGTSEDSILSLKLFTILPMYTFQLYITCRIFGTINEKKESIVFALYSCNWTDMNLESKKIILYAMKMNNAHELKLKFTRSSVINLELFTVTMRTCYSIFSMLVNYKDES